MTLLSFAHVVDNALGERTEPSALATIAATPNVKLFKHFTQHRINEACNEVHFSTIPDIKCLWCPVSRQGKKCVLK